MTLRWLIAAVLYTCIAVYAIAQSGTQTFAQIDHKIQTAAGSDSLAHYLQTGAALAYEKEHLHNWVSYTLEYVSLGEHYLRTFNDGAILSIWRAPKDVAETVVSIQYYAYMGYAFRQIGDIPISIQYYSAALACADRYGAGDQDLFGQVLQPLGNNFLRIGDFDKAGEIIFRMQEWASRDRDTQILAAIQNFKGLVHKLRGERSEAIAAFEKGLALEQANPAIRGKLASNLSLLWSESGDDLRAERYARQALELLKLAGTTDDEVCADVAITFLIIAQVKLNGLDLAAAYDAIRDALAYSACTDRRTQAKMLVVQGRILRLAGYPEHALDNFNTAIAQFIPAFMPANRHENPAATLITAENTLFEALEGKADAYYDKFNTTGDAGHLIHAMHCHRLAADAELILRRQLSTGVSRNILAADSRRRNGKALGIIEMLERSSGKDFAEDAFYLMEAHKANTLLESVYLRLQDVDSGQDASGIVALTIENLRTRERELQLLGSVMVPDTGRITALKREVTRLRLQLADVRAEQLAQFKSYATIVDRQISTGTVSRFSFLRDSGQVLIAYFLDDHEGYAVAVPGDGKMHFTRLPDAGQITTVAGALVSMLHSRVRMQSSAEHFGELAHWLYQRLIADVIGDIPGLSTLIIIPDGVLNYLPFEILLRDWEPGMDYAGMSYLIRDVAVQYTYSASVLSLQCELPVRGKGGIAFAPFDQDRRGFPELTYSRDEITQTGRSRVRRFLASDATFNAFLTHAPHSRIIHLATHAGVDSLGLGRIEFADSTMLLSDIYHLPLQCELAIISACESAYGRTIPGEGVHSFARAFTMAGTKGIIASLWRLNDASGASIVGHFYRHLESGHSVRSALHSAKLDYLTHPDIQAAKKAPHYWAPLVMNGCDCEMTFSTGYPRLMWIAVALSVFILLWILYAFARRKIT